MTTRTAIGGVEWHPIGVEPPTPVANLRTPPHGTSAGTERRREPRVRARPAARVLHDRLDADRHPQHQPRGVLIARPEPFPVGVTHQLLIAMDGHDSDVPVLSAQSV